MKINIIFKKTIGFIFASLCILQLSTSTFITAASADGYLTRLKRGLRCYTKGTPCSAADKKTVWKTAVGIVAILAATAFTVKEVIPGWKEFRAKQKQVKQWIHDINPKTFQDIKDDKNVISVRNALNHGLKVDKEVSLVLILSKLVKINNDLNGNYEELKKYKDNISLIPDSLTQEISRMQIYQNNTEALAKEIIQHGIDLDKKIKLSREATPRSLKERLSEYNFSDKLLKELGLTF